jgi:hypothetical protein
MTNSIKLGRAASYLSHFASGMCLTLVASAFLYAAEAQASAMAEPAPAACAADC